MNIQMFGMPFAAYFNPTAYGDFTGANYWVWFAGRMFADQKFMTIFSMLFGAGVIVFTARAQERGDSPAALHYRRAFWLLVIGLAHAYLLWAGDILVSYALCAMLVYPARKHPPSRATAFRDLVLEITESGMFEDPQAARETFDALRDLGVALAVDDFGTGYSSLAYLTTLPISELKIDKSFVHNLGVTAKSTAVITTIVALSRALGLSVIAEGVETPAQQAILHRQGCTTMQGFLYGRPMPGDQLQGWLTQLRIEPSALPEDDEGMALPV